MVLLRQTEKQPKTLGCATEENEGKTKLKYKSVGRYKWRDNNMFQEEQHRNGLAE
jgi:hypothetical protein